MSNYDYLKLRSSVSVVKINDYILEFFMTNTRRQVRLKVLDDQIMEIICNLDGTRTFEQVAEDLNFSPNEYQELLELFDFLMKKSIICVEGKTSQLEGYKRYRRCIHILEDYADSFKDLEQMWNSIRNSEVVIIGLGAVGSWVALNLVQSGIKKIVLVDNDIVDVSNLHRQVGFLESDIGELKTNSLERRLKEMNSEVDIRKINEILDDNMLYRNLKGTESLIINCADKPNVDTTSLWIGEYAMKYNIPHIVGGGYNLHLSLIGQTVIPYKTACVRCFSKALDEINTIDTSRVKKLESPNRKIGSFGPMCSIIASFIGIESIKILSNKIEPVNINRRGELNIFNMEVTYKNFDRDPECEWCGGK